MGKAVLFKLLREDFHKLIRVELKNREAAEAAAYHSAGRAAKAVFLQEVQDFISVVVGNIKSSSLWPLACVLWPQQIRRQML